jgi:hypothetical protein
MRTLLVLSLLTCGALSVAANAEPVKLTDTQLDQVIGGKLSTSNPGGQTGGCSGGNPNCVTVTPSGNPPPGQNK